MNILVFGYFGFNNFGDEWLFLVLKKLLFEFGEKNKKIFVLYNVKKVTINKEGLVYIPRCDIIKVIKTISKSDTVISCGGIFQDQTSIASFFYYFLILIISKIFGKKVVILSTEFVIEKLPLFVIKIISLFIDYIFVRSIDMENTKRNKVQFCPDLCLVEAKESYFQNSSDVKTLGLILKKNKNLDIKILQKMCMKLYNDYKLVFIPFHLLEDYELCLEIAKNLKNCEIRIWDKIENYTNLFKDIDLAISSRLHGIVLSIVLGIPFVCISEEIKLRKFLKTMFNLEPISLVVLEQDGFNIKKYIVNYDINKISMSKQLIFNKFKLLSNSEII